MEKPKGTKKHEQESQQEGVSITRVQNKVGDNQKNIKDTEALNKVKVEEESNVMFNPEEQDGSGLNEEKTFERQSETESNKREDLNSKNFSAECVTSGNKNESSKNLESNDALSHASKIGEKTEENSGSKVEEVILQESVPKKRVASQKETVKKLELDEVGDVENEETGEQVLKYIIKFCTDLFSSNTKTAENG